MNSITETKLEELIDLYDFINKDEHTIGFSTNHEVRITVVDVKDNSKVRMVSREKYRLLIAAVSSSFIGSKAMKKAVLTSIRKEIRKTMNYSKSLSKRAQAIIDRKV